MSRLRILAYLLVLAIMSAATSARAFDGKRRGFVLGGSAGLAITSFTQTLEIGHQSATSDRESRAGLATEFRIGGGISDRFLVYYANRVAWFSLDNALGNTVTIASSIGLVGVSYYLVGVSPSWYLHGLLGLSSWDTPFESDSEAWTGIGAGAGIGYEFSPHWSIEGSINVSSSSRTVLGIKGSTDAVSFQATVAGMAF